MLGGVASSSSSTGLRFGPTSRPDGISGSLLPAFQITRLILDWSFFFFIFSQRARTGSRRLGRKSLYFGGFNRFLLHVVNRVTSFFRAETKWGNFVTQAADRCPSGGRISTAYWCPDKLSARVWLYLSTIAWSQ